MCATSDRVRRSLANRGSGHPCPRQIWAGMTLSCPGCATEQLHRVSRPVRCHRLPEEVPFASMTGRIGTESRCPYADPLATIGVRLGTAKSAAGSARCRFDLRDQQAWIEENRRVSGFELSINLRRDVEEHDGAGSMRPAWLASLPFVVEELARLWSLEVGRPFQPGGSASWVAPVRGSAGEHLVLKVGWQHDEAVHEADGLRAWDGGGAVRLVNARVVGQTNALRTGGCRASGVSGLLGWGTLSDTLGGRRRRPSASEESS